MAPPAGASSSSLQPAREWLAAAAAAHLESRHDLRDSSLAIPAPLTNDPMSYAPLFACLALVGVLMLVDALLDRVVTLGRADAPEEEAAAASPKPPETPVTASAKEVAARMVSAVEAEREIEALPLSGKVPLILYTSAASACGDLCSAATVAFFPGV